MSDKLDRATYGVQDTLHFTSVPAADWPTLMPNHKGIAVVGAGALATDGNYDCVIPTEGLADLEIHLMPSAVTGSITPVIETLYANGHAAKAQASVDPLAASVLQTIAISNLLGVKAVRVRIPISSASVTFDAGTDPETLTAIAEYNGA